MTERVGTYRWQLTPEHGFAAAAAAAADLAAIGFSHVYLSPVAEAVPGSGHGYDAVDPTRLRDELGGEAGFAALVEAGRDAGLGLLVDIVPNHLAAHAANPWWWDVLRLGRASRWAEAFDVDWNPPKRTLSETILLPVLGDHIGRELDAGTIAFHRGDGPARLLVIRYHELELPVSPSTTASFLAAAARRSGDDVLGVAARVLERVEDPGLDPDARDADIDVAERTAHQRLAEPHVAAALDAELAEANADADRLDELLSRQHHRLARWQVGDAELDYRRFFDIDSLVATRVDRPAVFELLHRLPLRLVEEGSVDGLRVDHVDGLRDPQAYLDRLRGEVGADRWLLVEKILRPDEELPESWPVEGTTGYEVSDLLGGWLTDPGGAEVITSGWRERTGEHRSFEEIALEARQAILSGGLAADVERVVDALVRVCEGRRRHRDHSRIALHEAVVAVAAHAPAYRSYVRFEGGDPLQPTVTDADRAFVADAVGGAGKADPGLDPELLDLLSAVLTGRLTGADEADVALRFQQLTGPVAAKGEEDTALYRFVALPHRCEVGADPNHPHIDTETWHEANSHAQRLWPQRLTTLSTHDTKRSADVRARLAALTTVPDDLLAAFDAWWAATDARRGPAVDRASGWLVFHTLVGAHPLPVERAWPVIEKSVREAKLRTSWTDPDHDFEEQLRELLTAAVDDPATARITDTLVEQVLTAGDAASLGQLAAQLLAPGVPDIYQGGEGWDRSLVDPDNRRPVDPASRGALAALAGSTDAASAWADADLRATGLPRYLVLRAGLGLRREQPDAFGAGRDGAYTGIPVTGPDAGRVLAFTRGEPAAAAVVAVRPGPGATLAADATVTLPSGSWTDAVTAARHDGGNGPVRVDDLLAAFPVAVLSR